MEKQENKRKEVMIRFKEVDYNRLKKEADILDIAVSQFIKTKMNGGVEIIA